MSVEKLRAGDKATVKGIVSRVDTLSNGRFRVVLLVNETEGKESDPDARIYEVGRRRKVDVAEAEKR